MPIKPPKSVDRCTLRDASVDSSIPKLGDRLIHHPSGKVFILTRRTRSREGLISLFDGETRYPLAECKPEPVFKRRVSDPLIGKSFYYAGNTDQLKKQYGDINLVILEHHEGFAQCQGSNGHYYSWVALDSLKPVLTA